MADERMQPTFALIAKRLRWARELVHPTQAEFARALGVDKSTINKIEKGERSLSIQTLILAGIELRTGADYLLSGELRRLDWPTAKVTQLMKLHPELLEPAPPLPARRRPPARNLMGWEED